MGDAELAAEAMLARIRGQIETVRARVAGRPTVRTLIVLDEAAQFTVGPRNFLDDLLQVAGGQNVGAVLEKDYPRIDKEKLIISASQPSGNTSWLTRWNSSATAG